MYQLIPFLIRSSIPTSRGDAFRVKLLALFVALLVTLLSGAKLNAQTSLLDFSALHKSYLSLHSSLLEKESLKGDSLSYYHANYWLHGMLSAVEGGQDEALLLRTMHYIDNMLSKARDLTGDGFQEWGPLDVNGRPTQLYMYQALAPIARAAAVIMTNTAFRSKYQADAQRYIRFVDDHVIQYWYKKVYSSSKAPCSFTSPWADNCSHAAVILTELYRATGGALYRDLATQIGTKFKKILVPFGTGLIWDNGTYPSGYGGSYAGVPGTSHSNREAMMVVLMHEAGIVFSLQEVQAIANTLSNTIWNGSLSDPLFANYMNGSNVKFSNRTEPGSNGAVYFGWAMLGRYSSKAQQALSYLLKAIVDGKINPTTSYNSGFNGRLGLSGHLLRNSRFVATTTAPAALPFDFSISTISNQSVTQGNSASTTVSATLSSGTAQSISFSVSGLPSGASATFTPGSCIPTCSSVLRITASTSTPMGNYSVRVTGAGGGASKSATFNLNVTTSSSTTPSTTSPTLLNGKALSFDGVDDYVESGLATNSNIHSFSAWVQPTAASSSWPTLINLSNTSGNGYIWLYYYASTRSVALQYQNSAGATSTVIASSSTLSLNGWSHIAVTFNSATGQVEFYKNGTLSESANLSITGSGNFNQFRLGHKTGTHHRFKGVLDEVRIYNRALTAQEIAAHYNGGNGRYGVPETGLLAGWHFDETSGTTVSDYSGNGNTGNLKNGVTRVDR